ncbi:hypothetical protein [Roseibium aggregatum]|uniref:hypothetical protein n=1 Tax=Roseibium aggregatum TaxID=187304 RepID=UPI001E44F016|nr:hypothetical protein [Roseibium aggregatum]UES36900.1 hypothetical protein GFC08_02950 [Roseibium aggregatum]
MSSLLQTIVRTMSRDPEAFGEDDPLPMEHEPSDLGTNARLRDNLLLLAGIGLVLLATGMALSNVLS